MQLCDAQHIMEGNFIGPRELRRIANKLSVKVPSDTAIPEVPFEPALLQTCAKDFLLILAIPHVSISSLRSTFGTDPEKSEPCFYHQDWYLNEPFVKKELELTWHLLRTSPLQESRARDPKDIEKDLTHKAHFPGATLVAFAFFARYLLTGIPLFKEDFVWCADADTNGDRIYVGRYVDPTAMSKNGFGIHRHLSIRNCYGFAPEIA